MVQNSCWQSKSHKVKAFTLLESLIALIVISGSLLLFQAMSQLLISEVRYQQQSEQKRVAIVCGPVGGRIRSFAVQKSGRQSSLYEAGWQGYFYR